MGVYGGPNKVKGGIVFSLDGANPASYAGDSVTSLGTDYGYWAGGYSGSPAALVTTVDRLDFTSDTSTASPRGPLSSARSWGSGTGNTSYGYAGGGNPDGTKIDRLDYASDSSTTSPKGNLSQARYYLGAAGNNSYGYWGAGAAPSESSTVDRVDFSSDTGTTPTKGPLSLAKRCTGVTGNQSYGYWGAGATANSNDYISSVDRLDYSSDTSTASPKGPLTAVGGYTAATGNASYGYFGGGSPAAGAASSRIDRVDYSNDTPTAVTKGPLSQAKGYFAATGDTSYGYWGGGSPNTSDIDRLDYSSDTTATAPKGPLSAATRSFTGAVSSRANANPTTSSSTRSATQTAGSPYGYVGHGLGSPGNPSPAVSTVNRIDYSNDTPTTSTKGPLSDVNYYTEGTGSRSYGYMMGGSGPMSSHCRRIDYSNDTATAANKGPLSAIKWEGGATGNNSYGYYGGGYAPATSAKVSSVDRLDYSSDTTTAAPKGPLTATFYRTAATGNTSYGYWASIDPASSLVARIDYSNDTPTASAKGPLASTHARASATGNGDYGYWGGGDGPTSKVQRLDYSSDTTVVAKGPLSQARSLGTATGSTSYGYFAGGNVWPASTSTVDRIDYSNDTATAVAKGSLNNSLYGQSAVSSQANSLGSETVYPWYDTSGRGNNANITDSRFRATDGGYFTFDGTGDYLTVPSTTDFAFGTGDFTVEYWVKTTDSPAGTSYGYITGGSTPGSNYHTWVDRIDYSSDTPTATAKGPLAVTTSTMGTSSSTSYGYLGGGYGPNKSTVQRIDYSNDTATAVAKGPLSSARYHVVGAGNKDYGYQGAGAPLGGPTPSVSTIDRIDYSNDTATAAVKGPLSAGRSYMGGAAGNQSYGYFGGGDTWPSNKVTTVDRIDYSNDTPTATVKGPLGVVSYQAQVVGNDSYGYWTGGRPSGSSVSLVQRIDYGNDTATAPSKGPLDRITYTGAGTGNNSYGYIAGDWQKTSVSRIDYSSDTSTAASKGPLAASRGYTRGVSSREYGNPSTASLSAANIINPDSEKNSVGTNYWSHRYDTTFDWNNAYGDGTASNVGTDYGYFAGGRDYPGTVQTRSIIDRIDFSSDTDAAVEKGPLSGKTGWMASLSNQPYAWFASGAYVPTGWNWVSKIDRLDYSNDTTAAIHRSNVITSRKTHSGTSIQSYGYFAGGSNNVPATISSTERLDFANDTSTSVEKGPLSYNVYGLSATGNASYGYFGGGYSPNGPAYTSSIQRVDYSNDTPTTSTKGPLSESLGYQAAAGNASYGYWTGGSNPSPSEKTTVDRLDYSSDTTTAAVKGPLAQTTNEHGATGNTSYGYFGGGEVPSNRSSVQRIDYSNDTPTASQKGPLTLARYGLSGTSSRICGLSTTYTSSMSELYNCTLSPVNDGSWHHVVMTRESGTQQTYYDGVGITTSGGTYTDSTNYNGIDGWYIGKGGVGVSTFSGNLANITIRKGKGLSSDEVQQNFNALRKRFGV